MANKFINMKHVYRKGVPQESENQGEGSNMSDLKGVVKFVRFKGGGINAA